MAKRSKTPIDGPPTPPEASNLIDYFAAQLAASRTSEAVDAAQEVMFDAWECDDPRKRVNLARKALKISPDCADAYVLLAEETAEAPEQAVELYAQGVAAGERALGAAAFQEDIGSFWALLETRPYMRARVGLALALWETGATNEAVSHAEAMLQLNPNDNQGVRYLVLNWLQQLRRDAEAEALLHRYELDGDATWTWPAVLAAFRRNGGDEASRKALTRAVESNAHVAPFLLGRKRLPKALPDYVTVGGRDEAAAYVEAAAETWRMTPGALDWLASAIDAAASGQPAPKARRTGRRIDPERS